MLFIYFFICFVLPGVGSVGLVQGICAPKLFTEMKIAVGIVSIVSVLVLSFSHELEWGTYLGLSVAFVLTLVYDYQRRFRFATITSFLSSIIPLTELL